MKVTIKSKTKGKLHWVIGVNENGGYSVFADLSTRINIGDVLTCDLGPSLEEGRGGSRFYHELKDVVRNETQGNTVTISIFGCEYTQQEAEHKVNELNTP